VAPNLSPIVGDRKLLTQAFLNIIANAEQAISSGADHGSLMVSVSKVDDRVSVTFADDGPGIPAANLGKIFDPFFTTKRPGGGSGLGLTIALAVVKEHGGMIDVESRPGVAATFQVLLPAVIRDDARKTSSPSSSATTAPSGYDFLSGHTALIVDDEESIREIVSEGLLSRGMKVESAESAEKALSLLETNVYDVVLCDFNLPRLSGEELFERLRQRSKTSIPRFVFMTGELVDSTRIAELAEKGAAVLQKPFRIPALAQLLADMLESQSSKVL
jgi:two-component system cell cycle sensor histidine kinase/response regulator CckA